VSGDKPSWRECAVVLRDVLAGSRFEDCDQRMAYELIGSNLIERREQEKPCPACGKPKLDFAYWRVSSAGRMLVAALEDTPTHEGHPHDDE
jgi:hypothetical protein